MATKFVCVAGPDILVLLGLFGLHQLPVMAVEQLLVGVSQLDPHDAGGFPAGHRDAGAARESAEQRSRAGKPFAESRQFAVRNILARDPQIACRSRKGRERPALFAFFMAHGGSYTVAPSRN